MPTVDALLREARAALSQLEMPALDARLLLQHVTGFSQSELIVQADVEPTDAQVDLFRILINRRAGREPVSRILGVREFYGRTFEVTPDVLDPRADTEVMIEAVLSLLPENEPIRLLDLGTGSGIIAITLSAERPQVSAVAVDVSEQALAVASRNASRNGVTLQARQGFWCNGVEGRFDVIVSNPPYIETADIDRLDLDVRDHDPHLALDGGNDGLDCYRAIATQAGAHLVPKGFVAVEIGAGQAGEVETIFNQSGFFLASQHKDLAGHMRCLVFNLMNKAA